MKHFVIRTTSTSSERLTFFFCRSEFCLLTCRYPQVLVSLAHNWEFDLISQSGWSHWLEHKETSGCQFQTIMVTFISMSNNSGTLVFFFFFQNHWKDFPFLLTRVPCLFNLMTLKGNITALSTICEICELLDFLLCNEVRVVFGNSKCYNNSIGLIFTI